jgi:hypothetical protein
LARATFTVALSTEMEDLGDAIVGLILHNPGTGDLLLWGISCSGLELRIISTAGTRVSFTHELPAGAFMPRFEPSKGAPVPASVSLRLHLAKDFHRVSVGVMPDRLSPPVPLGFDDTTGASFYPGSFRIGAGIFSQRGLDNGLSARIEAFEAR